MKRLFYIRHGETEMNVAGIFSGQTETPLTKHGEKQVQAAAEALNKKLPRIDLIICSPLIRTFETARIIARQIGYPLNKIEKNPMFVERTFGILEGHPAKEFMSNHTYQQLDEVKGAESIAMLQVRAVKALRYIESLPQENILIVGHGSFGRALRRAVNDLPHTHEYEHYPKFRMQNAEIVELK